MDRKVEDPQTARYLRKKQQRDGADADEDVEDADFIANPMKTANKYGKKKTQRNVEKQVQYFGNAIQPFHMQKDDDMGDFDEEGFFLFNRKRGARDAWLDSIGEAEDGEVADKIAKRIKQQSRFQSVYEANDKINQKMKENSEDEEEENSDERQQSEEANEEEEPKQGLMEGEGLSVGDMVELMIQMIPDKGNANKYMKKLKAEKNMEEYNRLLTLSNEYIQKTGEYDILTKTKEQLRDLLESQRAENNDEQQLNWDDDNDNDDQDNKKYAERSQGVKQPQKSAKNNNDDEQDNIF